MTTCNEQWQSIESAPRDASWFIGKRDDIERRTHWASDLSGSDQPTFQGFFYEVSDSGRTLYFSEWKPTHWKPETP